MHNSADIQSPDRPLNLDNPTAEAELAGLFSARTAEEWRVAYAGAFDWGSDLGREVVEE
jgi:hypothetical protein